VASGSAAWGGKNPPHNTRIGRLPSQCRGAPTGTECINAAVYYLDKARSRVHLPPYALPANFPSLPPPRQLFILVNLDRVQYGAQCRLALDLDCHFTANVRQRSQMLRQYDSDIRTH
jgi:hypothetical protein